MIDHPKRFNWVTTSRLTHSGAFRGFSLLWAGFASCHHITQGPNRSPFRVRPRAGFRRAPATLLLLLLVLPAVPGQTRGDEPATHPKVVPLQSDTCPVVYGGDKIAFDWNPVFDPEWAVTGINLARLQFARLEEDGVHLQAARSLYTLGGRSSQTTVTALANGFYHVELTVHSGRATRAGVYRLVKASMNARVEEDYNGPAPQMTRSPVENRFCITLQRAQ
jgi:hypothetical protein